MFQHTLRVGAGSPDCPYVLLSVGPARQYPVPILQGEWRVGTRQGLPCEIHSHISALLRLPSSGYRYGPPQAAAVQTHGACLWWKGPSAGEESCQPHVPTTYPLVVNVHVFA